MILNFRCPNIRDFIATGSMIVGTAPHCCYNKLFLPISEGTNTTTINTTTTEHDANSYM